MLIQRFISYVRDEKRYSEHTISAYERDIKLFMEHIGVEQQQFDPQAVTADDIRGWIVAASKSGLAPTSINRMTSSLKALFRYARRVGALEQDPFRKIGFQRTPQKLPTYIAESNMGALIEAEIDEDDYIASRNHLIILIFYSTGIRLEELRQIKVGDFYNDMRELRVTGKGGKQRVVPIVEYTRQKIKAFIDKFSSPEVCFYPKNHLFLTYRSTPISRTEIYNAVREELAAAGVQGKRSPHILRHTFATHLMNSGADMKEIQELLGHASLGTTQIYTHNSITQLKATYEAAHPRGQAKEPHPEQNGEQGQGQRGRDK